MWFSKLSLTARTLLLANGIVLLGMVVLGFALGTTIKQKAEVALEESIVTASNLTSTSAREFIWNFDIGGLQALADKLSAEGDIRAADFLDKNEKSLIAAKPFTPD